tara:strand:- start:33 stop:776 length:744 start_codon:yes stop_codon:yes gene_type:complete
MNIFIRKFNSLLKRFSNLNRSLVKDTIFLLNNLEIQAPIIFDVGAYKGKWISRYFKSYPNLKGYLFEPSLESYINLKKIFTDKDYIKINNLALSDKKNNSKLYINKKDYTNSLLEINPIAEQSWIGEELSSLSQQNVEIQTIDNFCSDFDIKKINLLKLDVQGLEANVLRGSTYMLENDLIDLIVLEIITTPTYNNQSLPSEVLAILEKYNYSLFGIYDILKANSKQPILQFDVIYISSKYKEKFMN